MARLNRVKSLTRLIIPIVLIAIVGMGSVAHVWAANYLGYTSSSFSGGCPGSAACACGNPSCTSSQCTGSTNNCEGVGDIVIAPFAGTVQSISFYTSPSSCAPAACGLPNQLVILTASSGSLVHLTTTTNSGPCNAGNPCGKENAGDIFTIADVETLTGVSAATFTTVLLAGTVTVTAGQYVALLILNTGNGGLSIVQEIGQCPCLTTAYETQIAFGTVTSGLACPPSPNGGAVVGNQACSDVSPSGPPIVGATFIPSTSPVTQLTQCFGNCGSPAVTLANTNSTHTVAFNSSITLFYEFQSQLNGFVLNVTTSVAKNYVNGQTLILGTYTTSSNCIGSLPFTASCPGLLQFSKTIVNPTKGQAGNSIIITGNALPVSNGQWVGIALSGLYAPLDINDTNTNVAIFQTQGTVPAVLSQTSAFSANYKMGLWAWIVGNIVTGQPGTGNIVLPTCAGFLDCLLPNWVGSLCSNPTPVCLGGSSLIWITILAAFGTFFLMRGAGEAVPNLKLPIGEIFIFFALIWVMVLTGVGLLPMFAMIFLFFVISAFTAKHWGKFL